MGNLIKMDLRRLFITRAFIISMSIVAVLNILMAVATPILIRVFTPGKEIPNLDFCNFLSNPFSIGILAVALFISMVNFAYADFANGYIKNIAGQIPNKSTIIISRVVSIGVHNFVFLMSAVIANIIGGYASTLIGGNGVTIDVHVFTSFLTLIIKWMLIMAISSILMFITTGVRSKSLASVVGVFLGTGALGLVYLGLNTAIQNIFHAKVDIAEYAPDQLVNSVNVANGAAGVVNAIIVSIVCSAIFIALTIKVFKTRDIK